MLLCLISWTGLAGAGQYGHCSAGAGAGGVVGAARADAGHCVCACVSECVMCVYGYVSVFVCGVCVSECY